MDFLSLGKIGRTNRVVRAVIGVALVAVGILWVSGGWGIVLWVLGASLVLEGLVGFCPMTYLRNRAASKKAAQ